jgi:hypothetical protein
MPTLDDVAELAVGLPEAAESEYQGRRTWSVRGKTFAWERHFSKADIRRFGDAAPPAEPILAVSVADLHEKAAILATARPGLFTITHFDGYAAVLVELGAVSRADLEDLLVDGWLAAAPEDLADRYLATRRRD